MQGFFPGNSLDLTKVIHIARRDASWCIAHEAISHLTTYQAICEYAFQFARNQTYFTTYTDNPKLLYETYVDHFALVLANSLSITIPENLREIWHYEFGH